MGELENLRFTGVPMLESRLFMVKFDMNGRIMVYATHHFCPCMACVVDRDFENCPFKRFKYAPEGEWHELKIETIGTIFNHYICSNIGVFIKIIVLSHVRSSRGGETEGSGS